MDVRPSRLVLAGERAGTRVVSHPQLLVRTADTASGSTVRPPCCQCKVLSQEKLELLAFAGCMIRSAGNAPVIFALLPMLISRSVSFIIGPSLRLTEPHLKAVRSQTRRKKEPSSLFSEFQLSPRTAVREKTNPLQLGLAIHTLFLREPGKQDSRRGL